MPVPFLTSTVYVPSGPDRSADVGTYSAPAASAVVTRAVAD